MRQWIDFLAILLLSLAGMIGSYLVAEAVSVPDDITLLLFGTGMVSSAILIRTEIPVNKDPRQGQQ